MFEINGQVRLNISKFMVSHDKRQHVLFLFTCSEPRAQTGSASWLQFSVKVDSVGGGESHHGLAPAYLCGILGVLRFDWGWVGLLEAFPVAAQLFSSPAMLWWVS